MSNSGHPAGVTVLIVEDSLTQRARLRTLLQREGFTVIAAQDGEDALARLEKTLPDLVISDIQMPGIDGYELCRRIKQSPAGAELPVMLLTSLSAPEDIIHGLASGADNFVVKPYEKDFLLRRIDSVLRNRTALHSTQDGAGIPVEFAGQQYSVSSTRRQILSFLLSTYETAVQTNRDLIQAHEQLKAAQAQLIQAEKLQTIGRLAAGVAHEVRNPLAIMEMGLAYLGSLPLPPEGGEILEQMSEALKRADAVVAGLMESSSPREMGLREADLCCVLQRALFGFADELTRHRIELKTSFPEGLPKVSLDEAKMEQVFANILANATQAMPTGGRLTVIVSLKTAAPADLTFQAGDRSGLHLREGERVLEVEIADTGPGIGPDDLDKIFDPFFSTKPTGKGVGLGLTVARKIVELHSGALHVRNGPAGGAIATVTLKVP